MSRLRNCRQQTPRNSDRSKPQSPTLKPYTDEDILDFFHKLGEGVTAQGKEEGSPFREVATIITRIDSADQSRTVNNAVHEACLYPVFPERAGQGGGSKKTKRCKQLQTPFGTRVKHEFAKPFGNFVEGLIGAVL